MMVLFTLDFYFLPNCPLYGLKYLPLEIILSCRKIFFLNFPFVFFLRQLLVAGAKQQSKPRQMERDGGDTCGAGLENDSPGERREEVGLRRRGEWRGDGTDLLSK